MVLVKEMRMLFLTLSTMVVSVAVVMNAYTKKRQFYPTMIYLTKSTRMMSILYIQAFLVGWQLVKLIKFLFFGSLRAIEVEHLIEKSWFAVIDTFILLAAFHEELSPFFVGMVSLLFAVKSFHWLISDRIDHMEQSPVITLKFHIRSIIVLTSLCVIDVFFVMRACTNVQTKGMSVDIAFGLEYAIMLIEAINIYLRYILHSIDLRDENPWENKPIYIRYVNIVLGVFELILYAGYMAFMLMIPFIPLHIARRVYRTARDFQKSIYEVVTSHQAIRNLNTLYPDVTAEELQASNSVCIICREDMVLHCKKLPCNHIFHTNCLRSWFQRQHTCPTCRLDVLHAHRTRLQQQQRNVNNQQQPVAAQPHPQMMFPPMMGWPPPMHPPPPQQPEPNRQATPTGVENVDHQRETTPTNNQSQPAANNMPPNPFIPPPLGFPPFMMPPFPPIPPPMFGSQSAAEAPKEIFNGLTDEQLNQLEGMERSNVETRISLLRNIQKLLDTAVLQMNQYTTVMSSLEYEAGPGYHGLMTPPSQGPPTPQGPPTQYGATKDVNTPTEGSLNSFQRSQSLGNRLIETPTSTVGFDVKNLLMKEEKDNEEENNGEEMEEEEVKSKPPVVDEAELIRQCRLQRFHSMPLTTTLPSAKEKDSSKEDLSS